MPNYMNAGNYPGQFIGKDSMDPICGTNATLYSMSWKRRQAKIQSGFAIGDIYAGIPVTLANKCEGDTDEQVVGMNADTLAITAVATATDNVSGFVLYGDNDYNFPGGAGPLPLPGSLVQIGLLGSHIETWLPCAAALDEMPVNTPIVWNFTTGQLEAAGSGVAGLPITMVSTVVDGVALRKTGDDWGFTAVKCVRVQL